MLVVMQPGGSKPPFRTCVGGNVLSRAHDLGGSIILAQISQSMGYKHGTGWKRVLPLTIGLSDMAADYIKEIIDNPARWSLFQEATFWRCSGLEMVISSQKGQKVALLV